MIKLDSYYVCATDEPMEQRRAQLGSSGRLRLAVAQRSPVRSARGIGTGPGVRLRQLRPLRRGTHGAAGADRRGRGSWCCGNRFCASASTSRSSSTPTPTCGSSGASSATSGAWRTLDSVITQYLDTVRPAHEQFIEPSKRHADVIIPHGGLNRPALDVLLARVRAGGPAVIGAAVGHAALGGSPPPARSPRRSCRTYACSTTPAWRCRLTHRHPGW